MQNKPWLLAGAIGLGHSVIVDDRLSAVKQCVQTKDKLHCAYMVMRACMCPGVQDMSIVIAGQ